MSNQLSLHVVQNFYCTFQCHFMSYVIYTSHHYPLPFYRPEMKSLDPFLLLDDFRGKVWLASYQVIFTAYGLLCSMPDCALITCSKVERIDVIHFQQSAIIQTKQKLFPVISNCILHLSSYIICLFCVSPFHSVKARWFSWSSPSRQSLQTILGPLYGWTCDIRNSRVILYIIYRAW